MPSYSIIDLEGNELKKAAKSPALAALAGLDLGFFDNIMDHQFDTLRKHLPTHSYMTSREASLSKAHNCLLFSRFELKKQFATWLPGSDSSKKTNSMILASIMSNESADTLLLKVYLANTDAAITNDQVKIIDRLVEGYNMPFIIHLKSGSIEQCKNSTNLSKSQHIKSALGAPSHFFVSHGITIKKEVLDE